MSYASTFKGIKACLPEHLMELIDKKTYIFKY
jgi:hypothetical protein